MKNWKSRITGPSGFLPKSFFRRSLSCILFFVLLIVGLCLFAGVGILMLVNRAHGRSVTVHRHVVLIDQSGSVMGYPGPRELTRKTAQTLLLELRSTDIEHDDTISIDVFGAQRRRLVSETMLDTPDIGTRIDQAFNTIGSLGGTVFDQTLRDVFSETLSYNNVILITDGWPDPADGATEMDRFAYGNQLRTIAQEFAQRGTPISVLLTGNFNRAQWLPVWQDVGDITGGVVLEIKTVADLSMLSGHFVVKLLPSATPTLSPPTPSPAPTATVIPSPTPTPEPTKTAPPTVAPTLPPATATAIPTRPIASSTPLAPIILVVTATPVPVPTEIAPATLTARVWSVATTFARIGLCGVVFLFVSIVLTASRVTGRRRRRCAASAPILADAGQLDICSVELETSGEMKRVDLKTYVLGEVLMIGHGPQCDIDLNGIDQMIPVTGIVPAQSRPDHVMAALTFTQHGPLIEGRAVQLCVDGQVVHQHLLFDGDMVYIDRYAIYYTNFFRHAPPTDPTLN